MVKIIPFSLQYAPDFKSINEEWINAFFTLEEADRRVLENPQKEIISKGGHILMAVQNNEAVGTCALIPSHYPGFDYELVKMGVKPKAQGQGVGVQLGKAILDLAIQLGASRVFLESNRKLGSALNLYKKLGFTEIDLLDSPYTRCDIQMEWIYDPK
jgi:GNAT superfamily N-acetyltransferase